MKVVIEECSSSDKEWYNWGGATCRTLNEQGAQVSPYIKKPSSEYGKSYSAPY